MNSKWQVGDSGWEVEWCKELPSDPDYPEYVDRDNARMISRLFRTAAEAWSYAREVFPQCQEPYVAITAFTLEEDDIPPFYQFSWSETDLYEGEDPWTTRN